MVAEAVGVQKEPGGVGGISSPPEMGRGAAGRRQRETEF